MCDHQTWFEYEGTFPDGFFSSFRERNQWQEEGRIYVKAVFVLTWLGNLTPTQIMKDWVASEYDEVSL